MLTLTSGHNQPGRRDTPAIGHWATSRVERKRQRGVCTRLGSFSSDIIRFCARLGSFGFLFICTVNPTAIIHFALNTHLDLCCFVLFQVLMSFTEGFLPEVKTCERRGGADSDSELTHEGFCCWCWRWC